MKIGVVGAGAIGGWVAARLAAAGHDVAFLARGRSVAALRGGIALDDGETTIRADVRVSDDAGELGVQDLLIMAVKTPSLGVAARSARAMIGAQTIIVPMQNGVPWWFVAGERLERVDPDGAIAAALPLAQVTACVVHAACRRDGPAEIAIVHADRLVFGDPVNPADPRPTRVALLFAEAGIPSVASHDIRSAIWYKLWGNATLNPLSALTRAGASDILADPVLRAFLLAAMAELAEVGSLIGCPIAESGERRLDVTATLGAFKTSMLQDVEAGRTLELDALLGAPLDIARRVGVATPMLDLLEAQTRALARNLGLV